MLEISKVRWKNFLSYGDYETVLDLQGTGSCLITGEIDESVSAGDAKKSNGSGKSSIPNAILWGLFGRTMHSPSAGDSIINHFTKKTCEVIIDFKNGDQIIRRRKSGGTSELIFIRDGDESKMAADTVSTTKEMQSKLNRVFQLDYEIFCGSVFFNQYGKPWMEMGEASRRKALEKILRVDRFTFYSKVAKAKSDSAQLMFSNNNQKISDNGTIRERIIRDIVIYEDESSTFEEKRSAKIKEIDDMVIKIQDKIDSIILPNIDKLTEKWKVIEKIKSEIDALKAVDMTLYKELVVLDTRLNIINRKKDEIVATQGKKCATCLQDIPSSLIKSNLGKVEMEISTINSEIVVVAGNKTNNLTSITKYETLLRTRIPNLTIIEAKNMSVTVLNFKSEISRLQKMKNDVLTDSDPNRKFLDKLKADLKDAEEILLELNSKSEEFLLLDKHYNYIYKSYNDRNKVKSFMCEEHLPYINSRLEHYLGLLGLDIKLKIESDLKISTNMWGYDYQSGGERKRTDLAFMLSCNDFYEVMYGRQCNLMVLDEVDGRMDEDGIEGLINIIRNDLLARVDNVLVISHRNQMFDAFDREIKVKRINRLSMLIGN